MKHRRREIYALGVDFEDFGATATRKLRIAEIFGGNVLVEAIFGARFGGV